MANILVDKPVPRDMTNTDNIPDIYNFNENDNSKTIIAPEQGLIPIAKAILRSDLSEELFNSATYGP